MSLAVLGEIFFSLGRPPHYAKSVLLSRFFLQLGGVYIVAQPRFEWNAKFKKIISAFNAPSLAIEYDYMTFLVMWGIYAALVSFVLGFLYFVHARFERGSLTLNSNFLLRFVRLVAGLCGAFPVPFLAVLFNWANCDFGEFNKIPECLNSASGVAGFVGSIIASLGLAVVAIGQAFLFPSDPNSVSIVRRAHSRLELSTILTQFTLYILSILLPYYPRVFAVVCVVLNFSLYLLWIVFQPLYVTKIQDMQAGLATIPLWASICFLVIMIFNPHTTINATSSMYSSYLSSSASVPTATATAAAAVSPVATSIASATAALVAATASAAPAATVASSSSTSAAVASYDVQTFYYSTFAMPSMPGDTTIGDIMSIVFAVGFIPVAICGGVVSAIVRRRVVRYGRRMVSTIQDNKDKFQEAMRLYDSNSGLGVYDHLRSTIVEIAARSTIGPRETNIPQACSIMRRGIIRFPQSVYLRVQYCKFLLRAKTMIEAATEALESCDVLRMDFDKELYLLLLKREAAVQIRIKQQQDFGGSGNNNGNGGADTFDENELKQRLLSAKGLYLKCAQLMAEAWAELQKDAVRQLKKARRSTQAGLRHAKKHGKGLRFAAVDDVEPKREDKKKKAHDDEDIHHHKSSPRHQKKIDKIEEGEEDLEIEELDEHNISKAKKKESRSSKSKVEMQPTIAVLKSSLHNKKAEGEGAAEGAAAATTASAAASALHHHLLTGRSFQLILSTLESLRDFERKADTSFEFLLEKCPESPEVLHEYAAYVRGVKLDEKGAINLESRRDMAILAKESAAKRDFTSSAVLPFDGDSDDDGDDVDNDDEAVSKSSSSASSSSGSESSSSSSEESGERIQVRGGITKHQDSKVNHRKKKSSKKTDSAHKKKKGHHGAAATAATTSSETLDNMYGKSAGLGFMDPNNDYGSRASSEATTTFQNAEKNIAKDRLEMLEKVNATVSRLKMRLRISTLALLALAGGILWAFLILGNAAVTSTTDTDFSGLRRFGCSQIAYQSRRMHVSAVHNDAATFTAAKTALNSACNDFVEIHSLLAHVRTVYSSRLRAFYDEATVQVREVQGNNVIAFNYTSSVANSRNVSSIATGLVTGSQAADKIISAALVLVHSNMSDFMAYDKTDPSTFPELFFIVDNAIDIFRAMDTLTVLTVLETDHIVFLCTLIMGCLSGVALIVECFIILKMFRPAVKNLFVDLGRSIHQLSSIDRGERSTMASRFKAVKEQAEAEAGAIAAAQHQQQKDGGSSVLGRPSSFSMLSPTPRTAAEVGSPLVTVPKLEPVPVSIFQKRPSPAKTPPLGHSSPVSAGGPGASDSDSDGHHRVAIGNVRFLSGKHTSVMSSSDALLNSPKHEHPTNAIRVLSISQTTEFDSGHGGEQHHVVVKRGLTANSSSEGRTNSTDSQSVENNNKNRFRTPKKLEQPPGTVVIESELNLSDYENNKKKQQVMNNGAAFPSASTLPYANSKLDLNSTYHNPDDLFDFGQGNMVHTISIPIDRHVDSEDSEDDGELEKKKAAKKKKSKKQRGEEEEDDSKKTKKSSRKASKTSPASDNDEYDDEEAGRGVERTPVRPFNNHDDEDNDGETAQDSEDDDEDAAAAAAEKKRKAKLNKSSNGFGSKLSTLLFGCKNNKVANTATAAAAAKAMEEVEPQLSKSSMQRKQTLERWYTICLILVAASLVLVVALSATSTSRLQTISRSMNNVCRRRDIMRGMSWMSYELIQCYDEKAGLCGGVQRATYSEDAIRCHLSEMIAATNQVHEANLDGVTGWNRAGENYPVKTSYNTECSIFSPEKDLYDVATDLSSDEVRSDDRMNMFMFNRGECLASPGVLSSIPSLFNNDRTRATYLRFSDDKCIQFRAGIEQLSLGLHRVFDDIMLNFENIAFGRILQPNGQLSIPNAPFDYIFQLSQTSEEWGLGLIKGAMLMEAKVFDTASSNQTIVSSAFAVLVAVSLVQLLWLGSRVHQAIEDNLYVSLIVQRMLRTAEMHKKLMENPKGGAGSVGSGANGAGSNGANSRRGSNNSGMVGGGGWSVSSAGRTIEI